MRNSDMCAIPASPHHKVIHHIFFVLGSGYEWSPNGSLQLFTFSEDDSSRAVGVPTGFQFIKDDEIENHIRFVVDKYPTLYSTEDANFASMYPCSSWGMVQYDGIPDNASEKCMELIAEHCGLILASTTRKEWVAATNKVLRRLRVLRRKIETPSRYKIVR